MTHAPTLPTDHAVRTRLLETLELKALPRAGWQRVGIAQPETVAAHCWGVAWLVLALCPPQLDRGRALAMAVIHDLGEVRTGDRTPHDRIAPAAKLRSEQAAVEALVAELPHRAELVTLWQECEQGRSPEGRFVKACDRLDMALQAAVYRHEQAVDTSEFVSSALAELDDPTLRCLAEAPLDETAASGRP